MKILLSRYVYRYLRKNVPLSCPQCGQTFVQRPHPTEVKERLLSLIYIYPFRCQVCGCHFKAFGFGVHAKQFVDQRQYERLPTLFPAMCAEAVEAGESGGGEGVVTDISLGGCYLHTTVQFTEGALVALELQTSEAEPVIPVEAAIVRSVRPNGVGLEFLRLNDAAQERLGQFMRRLRDEQQATEPGTNANDG